MAIGDNEPYKFLKELNIKSVIIYLPNNCKITIDILLYIRTSYYNLNVYCILKEFK